VVKKPRASFGLAEGKATTDCMDYTDLDTKKDNTKIKTDVAGQNGELPIVFAC
jgi:hypothetical protein